MWDTVNAIEPPGKEFWDPVTFMPPEVRARRKMDEFLADTVLDQDRKDAHLAYPHPEESFISPGEVDSELIDTGHDNEMPGVVPWRTFQLAAGVTSIVWFLAGTYYLLQATHIFSVAASSWLRAEITEHALADDLIRYVDFAQQHPGLLTPSGMMHQWSGGSAPEHLGTTWPYPSISPQRLACDASGHHLLVIDGLSIYTANISRRSATSKHSQQGLSATLRGARPLRESESAVEAVTFTAAANCAGLLGETLQDVALLCDTHQPESCKAVVLHQMGRQITECPLQSTSAHNSFMHSQAIESKPLAVMQHWLEQSERVVGLSVDMACARGYAAPLEALKVGCISVSTTLGRSVQLKLSSTGKLAPAEEVPKAEGAGHGPSKYLHCIGGEFLYLLSGHKHPSLWRVRVPSTDDSAHVQPSH